MEHSFDLIKNEIVIAAGQNIIKGPDYRIRVKADKLIDEANRAAERIQAEAERQYQTTLEKCRQMHEAMEDTYQEAAQKGYQEGFAKAQHEYATIINDALIDRAEIIDRLDYSLVDMLMDSLRIILGDMGADETIQGIATVALRKAGRGQFAKLRVHPDRVKGVENVIDSIKKEFEGLEWIEVVGDTNLQSTDCLLQTSAGILDFSLDTQLRVLEACLRERVQKAGAL
jgi:type III secretion system HrpE/YscL family protein